jgi:hypothetical protein
MAIFSNLVKTVTEVFMDDFSIYGKIFKDCLANYWRKLNTDFMHQHVE